MQLSENKYKKDAHKKNSKENKTAKKQNTNLPLPVSDTSSPAFVSEKEKKSN